MSEINTETVNYMEKSQLCNLICNVFISLPAIEPRPTHFTQRKLFVFLTHCPLTLAITQHSYKKISAYQSHNSKGLCMPTNLNQRMGKTWV